ncbi:DASS family sodium-coupled anion symporter [Marinoscillum sp. MHG1-6]|uniref:SLC13 family permease n=1 Tax=Marinoscillum sp. MHG1-6 TaxID=2959627 RepID=UPI002157DE39|nr:DASS family sodium-coupled anion symporter [Marinoscillum sp. MHG1-6]
MLKDITATAKKILLQNERYQYLRRKLKAHATAIKIIGCLVLPLLIIFLPAEWTLTDSLTVTQHRTVFIFALAAIFWILEPIPIFATSVLVILLELILISDSGLNLPEATEAGEKVGVILSYKAILGTFASPIIFLFLGGFFLAISATKYGLDQVMAKTFIKPFGTNPKMVMLGLMIVTAVFSMFMSNTATTAMMLSILMPVLAALPEQDKGRTAFILCIPVAANVGGLGTPIGTPPNALAMKYLMDFDITFSKWMLMGVPAVIILVALGWTLLNVFFPTDSKEIKVQISTSNKLGRKSFIVYATFSLTVLLWLTDFIHGMNSYVVAFIPVVVFLSLNILGKEDLKLISWDVLWLVSGGLALGLALEKTGLAQAIINGIPFGEMNLYVIFIIAAFVGLLIANFMSNTATANLMLPLIAIVGSSLSGLEGLGGSKTLILSTTLCISLGMALPISTPPNALAYSTGLISTKHMSRVGVLMGLIGMVIVFGILYLDQIIGII